MTKVISQAKQIEEELRVMILKDSKKMNRKAFCSMYNIDASTKMVDVIEHAVKIELNNFYK